MSAFGLAGSRAAAGGGRAIECCGVEKPATGERAVVTRYLATVGFHSGDGDGGQLEGKTSTWYFFFSG